MIAPVIRYNIAGAIWYQGEGNVVAPETYGRLFTTMIRSWRKAWEKDLPFYYVQIAPFTYGKGGGYILREQQAASMKLENTGMVVISDLVDDTTNIHPKNKHDVGLRLANWALAETYHKSGIAYKNPAYTTMETKGNKIWVSFENAEQGLVVKGKGIKEIFIAGADKVFYPAEAKVEGSRLVVSSKSVRQPVAVRYQFSNAGIGNVFSKEGLPMAPFRTDDW
jgi:sialate O-acetylesterase